MNLARLHRTLPLPVEPVEEDQRSGHQKILLLLLLSIVLSSIICLVPAHVRAIVCGAADAPASRLQPRKIRCVSCI